MFVGKQFLKKQEEKCVNDCVNTGFNVETMCKQEYFYYVVKTGAIGENIAAKYLKDNGYKIVETNWKRRWAEIDIVAVDRKGVLVLVEVKSTKSLDKISNFQPECHFDKRKREKLRVAGSYYVNERPELIKEELGWRIDLITVTIGNKEALLKHYRNAASLF